MLNLALKRNWLCEYNMMKYCLRNICTEYDMSKTKYVNKSQHRIYFYKNHFVKPTEYKCSFFYGILRDKKFETPNHQSFIARNFHIQSKSSWSLIYTQKISKMYDRKVAEFNFKLFNNLLANRYLLSKWNSDIEKYCLYCQSSNENNEHLIFLCENVKEIWKSVSDCLKFDVSWKNIILGFYDELNDKTILLNNIISFIAYRIYKYKMFCRLDNNRESIGDIRKHIKHSLLNQYYVLMKTSCSQNISLFEKISNAL